MGHPALNQNQRGSATVDPTIDLPARPHPTEPPGPAAPHPRHAPAAWDAPPLGPPAAAPPAPQAYPPRTSVPKARPPTAGSPAATPPPGSGPSPCHPPRDAPGPGRGRVVAAALMLTTLLATLDQTVVATALPEIAGELGGVHSPPWVVTAYLLAAAVVMPVHGKLGDLLGRKGVFLCAVAVFSLGSGLAGWSRTMEELIVFRAVQGAGAGGLVVGAQAIIADLAPPRSRARYLGLFGAAFGVAAVAGPLLGGWFTDTLSWRWCFIVNVPAGLLTLLVIGGVPHLPRPRVRRRLDVPGALLLAALSTCLVLLATWGGGEYAWHDPVILGLAGGALLALPLFLLAERRAAEPLLPPRLFRDRTVALTSVLAVLVGAALFGATSYLPGLLRMVEGVSATRSGLLMLPMAAGLALASVASGLLISRTGRYRSLLVLGCACATAGMWLLSRLEPDAPRHGYALWTALLGIGVGLVLPALIVAAQNAVPTSDLGVTTGAHTYFRQIGGSAGAALLCGLLSHRLAAGSDREPPPDASGLPGSEFLTPQLVTQLPTVVPDSHAPLYAEAMPGVFRYLAPVLLLALLIALALKESPLLSQNASVPSPRPSDNGAQPPPAPSDPDAPTAPVAAEAPAARNRSGAPVCGSVRHPDGSGVARAALTLVDGSGRQVGRGGTGEDGRYALGTPGEGSYVLIAAADGHQPRAVTVTVRGRPVDLDVVLGGAGSLSGSVCTADGHPVREAAVTLTDACGEVVASARTARDGGYLMAGLVAGEYTLAASASAYRPAALPVSVRAAHETRQDLELAGGSVLRGAVRADGGQTVTDARVTLVDAAGNVVDTATTGPDGAFRFVDLSAGEYTVIASGYPPVATALRVDGGGRTEQDLHLGHDS
ncbi:MFS transporter [Streptomyces sp. AJS327]|uniref:MFS transporter n=1 Tax=Streptomyces sp. AJS327 TaxID=2545265 RepID=UPI0015DFDF73|nr:MFS transporter [Streptomyces sp. AJS327]MBA0052184.1 MFS transporter [Streptomyces sp. AJS327]